MVIVTKFGGTSAKDGRTLEYVINNIILTDQKRRIAVFSGPGKRFEDDVKVTDILIGIGKSYLGSGEYPEQMARRVKGRFTDITNYFGIGKSFLEPLFAELDRAIKGAVEDEDLYIDSLKPFGEIINAEIVVEIMKRKGVNVGLYRPENIGMVTDGVPGNARLLDSSYELLAMQLNPIIERTDKIMIIPGFYGVDRQGIFVTFKRGGSDLTGSIVANATNAEAYENFTDVDGVKRVRPKIIQEAGTIQEMTYDEMEELGFTGAEVIMFEAIEPLIQKSIPLIVRNTWNINGPYTVVKTNGSAYRGITGISDKVSWIFTVRRRSIKDVVGYGERLLGIFREHSVSYDYTFDAINSINVVVSNQKKPKIEHIEELIKSDPVLRPDYVDVQEKTVISVVAEGMSEQSGVLHKLTGAFYKNGINIWRTDQGSDRSILFIVDIKDAVPAVKALYNVCFGPSKQL